MKTSLSSVSVAAVLSCGSLALSTACEKTALPLTLDPAKTVIVQGGNVAPATKLLQDYLRKAYDVKTGFNLVQEPVAGAPGRSGPGRGVDQMAGPAMS